MVLKFGVLGMDQKNLPIKDTLTCRKPHLVPLCVCWFIFRFPNQRVQQTSGMLGQFVRGSESNRSRIPANLHPTSSLPEPEPWGTGDSLATLDLRGRPFCRKRSPQKGCFFVVASFDGPSKPPKGGTQKERQTHVSLKESCFVVFVLQCVKYRCLPG